MGAAFPYLNYAVDKTYEQIKVLIDVMGLIQSNYVENVDQSKLIYGAAKGMVDQLDDYSQFYEPDVYTRVKSDTDGEFGGIGISIESRTENQKSVFTVTTPLPGTPAWKVKMMPGDVIIKVDGQDVTSVSTDDFLKMLRGEVGTEVTVTASRVKDGKNEEKNFVMKRDLIKTENVKWRMLDKKIGYINVLEFTGHVTENFDKAMKDLTSQGMTSLILDLRYNPGGLLSAAVDISQRFLGDNKMIVYTKGRKQENYQEFRADKKAVYPDLPLVVLINRFSASASEIVSGALQDNKRAVVIGERSFGKASVQSMIPLADKSALRLTIAKYYTPSGKSIQHDTGHKTGGIVPDITVKMPLEQEQLLQQKEVVIYYPDENSKDGGEPGADGNVKKVYKYTEEKVRGAKDDVIDRAVEILHAKDVLGVLGKTA